ncbi:MAG: formate-dependent phosphoribosylglycinamide formyltransferase [Actinomycetaceae bacterium]|nr:formate-dependent phosphoribosylglycinamide formyltransferase [Actinomycetaceae bacterium]
MHTQVPVTVLLLGSGELGKELTISLQRLGCVVHAVDSYDSAPAMALAHRSHVLDMTDVDAVRGLLAQVKPDFVVPEVEKLATAALADWIDNEGGGKRVVPSVAAVSATFDRRRIRQLAAEKAGVPTSKYAFAGNEDQLQKAADAIGYPCFVKPTMSSSGHGQSYVQSHDQIPQAWENALVGARATTNWVIVEGKVAFDYEITLLTVRHMGADGQVHTSFCAPIGHRQQDGDYVESWQPQEMSPQALERAKQVAKAVTDALADETPAHHGPCLGIFGVELFVCGDDIVFSELSPRPHDTGMVTLYSQRQSEFDLHARAILGLPIDTTLVTPAVSVPLKSTVESSSPTYSGVAQALAVDPKVDVRIFGKPQAHVGRRMAVVLAAADTVWQARQVGARAHRFLRVD